MSVQACAHTVQRGDPDRFLATMAVSPSLREKLFPIYAFNVEIARAPWVTQEPMIAEMRLQWWRDALEEIAQGKAPRQHEVVTPLATVIDVQGAEILDKTVQARRWDIYKEPFQDATHFDEYLDATAAGVLWSACRAAGASEDEIAVRDIGYASGLANWFLAIPKLSAAGRIPLLDGRPQALSQLADRGLQKLANLPAMPKSSRAVTLSAWRAKALLKMVRRDPALVLEPGLQQSEFSRRGTLLWQSFLVR